METTIEYDFNMPLECYQYAEIKFGETKEVREQSVCEIIKWLNDNPNVNGNCDTKNILYFLRNTKFNVDNAKTKMEKFYKLRAQRTEWFSNRNPFSPEITELLDLGVFLPLKKKDNENRQIFIIRTSAHNPSKHKQDDVFKVGKMLVDLVFKMDETISIYGAIAIFDMNNVTLQHALQLNPALIKRLVECWETYPCMPKKLQFINAPFHVNVILNTFRLFMTAKMKKRISVTRNIKSSSNILIENLPTDIGGNGENYIELSKYWKQLAQENECWYKDQEAYRSIING